MEMRDWNLDIIKVDLFTTHGAFPYNKGVDAYKYLGKHPRLWRVHQQENTARFTWTHCGRFRRLIVQMLYYWTAAYPGRRLDQIWSALTNKQRLEAALATLDPVEPPAPCPAPEG
jgi:hypothetical protein